MKSPQIVMGHTGRNRGKKKKIKKSETDLISEFKMNMKHQKDALIKILKHIQDEKKTVN